MDLGSSMPTIITSWQEHYSQLHSGAASDIWDEIPHKITYTMVILLSHRFNLVQGKSVWPSIEMSGMRQDYIPSVGRHSSLHSDVLTFSCMQLKRTKEGIDPSCSYNNQFYCRLCYNNTSLVLYIRGGKPCYFLKLIDKMAAALR